MIKKLPEKIKKRDGRVVPFEQDKITDAITKAGNATGEYGRKEAEKMSDLVIVRLISEGFDGNPVDVEQVQDFVEETIMKEGYFKTAKAYVLYRELHRRARDISALLDVEKIISEYLGKMDWKVKENANMAYSLQGLNIHISTAVSAKYWLTQLYAPEARDAHDNGDLHIHDLYLLAPYCCGWELRDFLVRGFGGVPGKIESKPPRHFRVAMGQLVNWLYTLQGEAAGAEAVSNFDSLMAPFIRYDGLDHKQVKQVMQEFLFSMNVPTRVGFQCVSEDTDILTPEGWRGYEEIKEGEIIKTFNVRTEQIENQKVESVFKKGYKGKMYRLQYEGNEQLISPGHRVVRKEAGNYVLQPIEEILDLSSPIFIPIIEQDAIKEVQLEKVQECNYQGIIWCPHTKNETIIARRNGKVFITGNTPFTNVTLDLKVPEYMKKDPVIIGGRIQKETYGDFQEEMDMFNKAFAETMMEGDAKGRIFSVDFDSICPIKNSHKFKLVKIGEYIDSMMEEYKPISIKENNAEVLDVRRLNLKCVGLKKGNKTGWQKINFLIRHPQKEILEITAAGGFKIKATPSHSVLVLKGGKIIDFPAKDLKRGDYLIAPKKLPSDQNKQSCVCLASMFAKKNRTEGLFLTNVFRKENLFLEKRPGNEKNPYGYKSKIIPLENIKERLKSFDLCRAKINLAGSNIKIANYLPVSKELVEFLGWYCAEGSAEKGKRYGGISLAFNLKEEKKEAKHLKSLIEKVFKVSVTERIIEKRNLFELRANSKLLRRIVTEIFEIGNKEEKKVPDIIFDLSDELKKVFLRAYFEGDAWIGKMIAVNTISKKLAYGISTLLKQLDVHHLVEHYFWKGRQRYRIAIWSNLKLERKEPYSIGKIPIKESGIEDLLLEIVKKEPVFFDSLGRKYKNSLGRMRQKSGISKQESTSKDIALKVINYGRALGIKASKPLVEIIRGDLLFLKIKRIEKSISAKEMVYDFSTESENFVADQLLVHNTFPIPTINITKDFNWENPVLEPVWEMTARYGIPYFANFVNSDMDPEDARSMCPLAASERALTRSTRGRGLEYSKIGQIFEGNKKEDYEIYSDGGFVKGRFNKFENQQMIKVALENGHEIKQSKKHLNFVLRNTKSKIEELQGEKLEPGMYLPYSLKKYKGEGGNKDLGFFVGAYAGDGSFDEESSVVFSLEREQKKEVAKKLQEIAMNYFGSNCSVKTYEDTKLLTLKVHSKAAVGLCKDFVDGIERRKRYKARLFGTSIAFREGVMEGHYAADGGNRHRIYTSSQEMVESLNMLAATLGTTTSVYKDERENRLGKEPNFAVLVYQLNRKNYGEFWFKKYGKLWVKIKEIKEIGNSVAYCFEVEKGKPVFTVGTTGILTHNCRLRLDNKELRKRGGGYFGANPLTGSHGVVTVNLPRIGFLSKTRKEFFERLDQMMGIARRSLIAKRKILEKFTEGGLYPYSRVLLGKIKDGFGSYWYNHFSTIGIVGGNEACVNLLKKDLGHPEARRFMEEVLEFMNKNLTEYQANDDQMYNLEATPAEGASYRLAKIDKQKYPDIDVANEEAARKGAAPYYTNSSQLPVDLTQDLFGALDMQDALQCKYTGGTVFHAFLAEKPSAEMAKKLVRKVADKHRLPYFTLTPTFSVCMEHGYIAGEHQKCPTCQKDCEVYSRIVGYIRPVNQWNEGKQEEFKERLEFKI